MSVKNILFIMCDQLRFDYLSCAGHDTLQTPHIDGLAARGVRFTKAYVQSPVCGSSRMSFYTGRYVHSHGASYNLVPLKVGEMTMGDYLRPLGRRTVLVGKTHMTADKEGMARLGISADSEIGVLVSECGFEPYEREDGIHPRGRLGSYNKKGINAPYQQYLRDLGYVSDNPWADFANASVEDADEEKAGDVLSGWFLKNSRKPARVKEEHSETPYMTRKAIEFIEQAQDEPWCLHLSYIKPHWPYIAPAPYNDMYSPNQVQPVLRSAREKENPHPIFAEFMKNRVGKAFVRDEVRREVIPAYMGLIKQIDDQMGVLFKYLEEKGLFENTMIVFTSDHGDYLGDHWLGEKDLFHDQSVKIPMIVYDPSPKANATRGTACDELVESIDLLPTFVEACGGEPQPHRLEGLSLLPLLRDEKSTSQSGKKSKPWRQYAISEYDFSTQPASVNLNTKPIASRLFMVCDENWKYIATEGFRPMLFDLKNDPEEFFDLGEDANLADVRQRFQDALNRWGLRWSQRTTISDQELIAKRGRAADVGVLIGYWDIDEVPAKNREPMRDILSAKDTKPHSKG
ncbi:MAG: sulfatase-like hydrolase/transferase [Rhizobiaceae bacterium]